MNDVTKPTLPQCPSYGLVHDSPYLGDLPQGSSAYVEGCISIRVLLQPTSGALEQSVMPAAPHTNRPAPPAQPRGVGFAHFDYPNASPVRLVLDVLPEFPEGPRIQLSVEPSTLTIASDAFWVPDCDDGIQPLRFVDDGFSNFMKLVVRDVALPCTDSLDHLQQLLLSKSSP